MVASAQSRRILDFFLCLRTICEPSICISMLRTNKKSTMSFNSLLSTQKVVPVFREFVRNASKKTGGSTQNQSTKVKPKRRGWKVQDGHFVQPGHMLATQRTPRFHPGLNVGFGRNGTLFAMVPGKVVVTCEKFDPDWTHTWVQRVYSGREEQTMYKKYFNIIPEPQQQRFKLVDEV